MNKIRYVLFGMLALAGVLIVTPAPAKAYEEGGLRYEVFEKEATITGLDYSIDETGEIPEIPKKLVIPSSIGGFPVTDIRSSSFCNENFEEIVVPDTVKTIGGSAFSGNRYLKKITLPKKLKSISHMLLEGCTKLEDVKLGNSIKTIGKSAFEECISLKKITFPGSLREIGDYAFYRCYKLSSVSFDNKLEKIGKYVFARNYALKKASLPKSVKTVKDYAFSNCKDLSSVSFANPDTRLGDWVFSNCESLEKAVLPSRIKSVPEATFYNCVKLKKVKFPKSVSIIKKKAFMECKALKTVKLNQKTYAIGDKVFAESGLKKITLNARLQFVGNGAFRSTKIENLKLQNRVTYIGNKLFENCRKLKTISIPASVKGINPGAFNNCISLRAINVAADNRNYSSQAGVLYNKGKTKLIQYPLHKASASFVIPGSVRQIRSNAFAGNKFLRSVVITARRIGSNAFANMSKLASVTVQSGTVKIANTAFYGNESLKKLVLPDSVVKIGSMAFANTSVKHVHIPSGLKELGTDAFTGCYKLTAFDGGGAAYTVLDGVLYNKKKTHLIQYPARKADRVFVVPNGVRRVYGEAFDHVAKLVKLEFGRKLTRMGYHAIYRAKKLKSITFKSKKLLSYRIYGSVMDCNRLAVIVGPNDYAMHYLASVANATLITL